MSTNHIRRRTGHRPRYLRMLIVLSALIPATVCAGSTGFRRRTVRYRGPAVRRFGTVEHDDRPLPPSTDPRSAQMVRSLQPQWPCIPRSWSSAFPSTSPDGVPCATRSLPGDHLGPCPFSGLSVPVPNGARPSTGSDSAMVVVDERTNAVYEFWRVHKQGRSWSAAFGAVNTLTGSGWGGAATGSGASRLGGVVRLAEIARGNIPHALALQTNNACAVVFRPCDQDRRTLGPIRLAYPKEPGCSSIPDRPELTGLTPRRTNWATAMQRYGGYIVDIGSSALSVSFERDPPPPATTSAASIATRACAGTTTPRRRAVNRPAVVRCVLVLIDAFRMGGAETLLAPMAAATRRTDMTMDFVGLRPSR